ncbi:unnamed protein product [Cunninghamella blakesleeana]
MTNSISYNHALCIFFQFKYNEENVIKAKKKFEAFIDEYDICYLTDPKVPVMALKTRIYGSPFMFKEYFSASNSTNLENVGHNEMFLETKEQVVKFINEVYNSEPNFSSDLYTPQAITLKELFINVLKYSTCFGNKTLNSFASFCGKNNLNFMKNDDNTKRSRININGSYSRIWNVFVLNQELHIQIVNNIVKYSEIYHSFISDQKSLGVEIIGYARKSPGSEKKTVREKLLNKMVENLKRRSLVEKVFVSPSSNSSTLFNDRDKGIKAMSGTDGTMIDLINHLGTTEKEVILVVIDYSGFSTNIKDIRKFLS